MNVHIPRVGNNPTDLVRFRGVLHEILEVRADGTRIYINCETGHRLKLTKPEQLEYIGSGDLFSESQSPKVDEDDLARRLDKDWQLQLDADLERAAWKAKFLIALDEGGYSPKQRRRRKTIRAVIEKVMADDTSGFKAPSVVSIRRDWDPLWLRAKTLKVLLDNFGDRGRHGGDPEFAELDALTVDVMEDKIARDGGVFSIPALSAYVDAKVGILAEERGLKLRPSTKKGRAIGKNRVRELLEERNYGEKNVGKLTKREARRRGQGITIGPRGEYPLHQVEVDHSPMDIMVLRPGKPPARPWITVLIDRYTRYIIGFYISFDPPGWFSVAMALRLAVAPKGPYLKSLNYNFKYTWLAFGSPDFLYMDRAAEFQGNNLLWAARDLRIGLKDMPAASGQNKGKVERLIGTVQREVCKRLPGYTGPSITERDPDLAAPKLYLHQLEQKVAAFIVDRYHPRVHPGTGRKPQDLWVEAQSRQMNVKPPPSPEILGPMGSTIEVCTLSERGLSLDGLQYYSDDLVQLHYDNGGTMDVLVRADPLEADKILVRAKTGWIPARLIGPFAGKGYTRDQALERRAISLMSTETEEETRLRREAIIQHEDDITATNARGSRSKTVPKTAPKKTTTHISRAPLDAEASHDGFLGYSPDRPATLDLYGSAGPFAENSLAADALDDLPVAAGPNRADAIERIAEAQAEGRPLPRSTPPDLAHLPKAAAPPRLPPLAPQPDDQPIPFIPANATSNRPRRSIQL